MTANLSHRYEQLAGLITGLVDDGVLRPGSRAPSLRRLSKDQRTSLSTALQAYQLLEDRGVLEARLRSGYYVAHRARVLLEAPAISAPPGRPTSVAISATLLKLLEHAADQRLVPLGCAIPSAELLAAGRLDRFLSRAARVKGMHYNVYTAPQNTERPWPLDPSPLALSNTEWAQIESAIIQRATSPVISVG